MKVWSGIVLAVGLFSSVCVTQKSVAATPACLLTLEWQPSVDATVTGYALYYGAAGEPLTNRVDVGAATSIVLTNLTAFTNYSFYVVSYNADQNESDPSNLLNYTGRAISCLKLGQARAGAMVFSFAVSPGATCHVEYTDELNPPNWQILTAATGDSNGIVNIVDTAVSTTGSRFYRAMVP